MGKRNHLYHLKHRGNPVDGIRVELLNGSGTVISRTATVAGGQFLINTNRLPEKPAVIRFLDAESKVVGEEKWSAKRNFKLADRRRPRTLEILARQTGPLLRHHHLNRLSRLLEKHVADKKAVSHYKETVKRLLPALDGWDDVVLASAGVLDGDPSSIERFREILGGAKPAYFGGRQGADLPRGFEPDHYPRRCLLAPRVYEQMVLATQLAARTASEYKNLSTNLENGLAGVRTLERVVNAAMPLGDRLPPDQSAHIAEKQFDQLGSGLDGLPPWPPEPGGGLPPWPPEPGGGLPPWPPEPDGGLPGVYPIEDFIPEVDLCEIFRQQCIPSMSDSVFTGVAGTNDGNYRIDTVSHLPAATGQIITITGVNFGPSVSAVRFPKCGGGTIQVQPISDTETQVRVQVPQGATHGPISLVILLGTVEICGNITPVYEWGEEGYFEAASPSIGYLTVDGDDTYICVESGDPIVVEWFACPTEATVELRYGAGAWQTVDNVGERQFTAPPTSGEDTLKVTMLATTPAGSVTQSVEVRIVGVQPVILIRDVEFTQGIQTMFRDDGTPDNSLELVANKDTMVRVYVDVDRNGFNNDQMEITGQIRIEDEYLTLRPYNSGGWFLDMDSFSEGDRNTVDGTLNFLIPLAVCNKPLELEITIVGDWSCDPKPSDTRIENISFRDVPAMGVRIRRIRGRAGNAPSTGDAMNNVTNAFTYLPSPATNISLISGVHNVSWLVGQAGGYSSNTGLWLLSQDVSSEHWGPFRLGFDGNIWVGLTARSNRGIMAWPDSWTCISHVQGTTENVYSKTAHEICHCLGFGHVRNSGGESCNDLGLFDTTCEPRRYEGPLPDVPFRVRLNDVISDARDLMGYERISSRFLNPDFWVRAMNEIDDRWN